MGDGREFIKNICNFRATSEESHYHWPKEKPVIVEKKLWISVIDSIIISLSHWTEPPHFKDL